MRTWHSILISKNDNNDVSAEKKKRKGIRKESENVLKWKAFRKKTHEFNRKMLWQKFKAKKG